MSALGRAASKSEHAVHDRGPDRSHVDDFGVEGLSKTMNHDELAEIWPMVAESNEVRVVYTGRLLTEHQDEVMTGGQA